MTMTMGPRVLTLLAMLTLMLGAAAQAADAPAGERPIALETPGGAVHGTLRLPAGAEKMPVVLIVAGSGPTDRDGNSAMIPGRNDSLKLLAEALAQAGFASVRYDKRGIAASRAAAPEEAQLRFDTYVEDAAAWIATLKADPRFTSVAVIGHSEGALIGMLAAQRAGAAAYVSLAGAAEGPAAVLRKQFAGKLPPPLAADNERILGALEQGRTVAEVPPALAALYRPSMQPYLISWMKYVPTEQIARLRMPVLIVQGSTDIQVDAAQARALKAARPDAALVLIPDMNHVLKEVPLDSQHPLASYGDPSLPLHPQLAGSVTAFLRTAFAGGKAQTR
ncbi:alpha/beta hydrolase [Massilia sp. LXY-6]|uniref:alpha/beta hydrolase n=1 Tax=Massilia sp. LXY-6 TaxID=3379823 RepID=UPI003EE2E77D